MKSDSLPALVERRVSYLCTGLESFHTNREGRRTLAGPHSAFKKRAVSPLLYCKPPGNKHSSVHRLVHDAAHPQEQTRGAALVGDRFPC